MRTAAGYLRLLMRMGTLAAAAVVCGTLANVFSPARIPWVEDWGHYLEAKALQEGIPVTDIAFAKQASEQGSAILLDARPAEEFREGHIPGAISLPQRSIAADFEHVKILLTREHPVIAYCSGRECDDSLLVAVFLREQGFTNVSIFVGGFPEWEKLGYAVAK